MQNHPKDFRNHRCLTGLSSQTRRLTVSGVLVLAFFLIGGVGLQIALGEEPSSDDPSLPYTQIVGELPERETAGTAFVQWGGGTLFQLTARLAVNGCDLSLLWVWDDASQQYTGYTFQGPSFLNQPFNDKYAKIIPASTIWIRCTETLLALPFQSVDGRTCGNHWYEEVQEAVLAYLPVPQASCMWRVADPDDSRAAFGPDSAWVRHETHNLWEYRRPVGSRPGQPLMSRPLDNHPIWGERGRMHPTFVQTNHLCMGNIQWYLDKWLGESPEDWRTGWYDSPAGQAYLDRGIHGWTQHDDGSWSGNNDWKYSNPLTEAWNMCSYYVGFTGGAAPQSFLDDVLTPDVIDWVEDFMFVLPREPVGEENADSEIQGQDETATSTNPFAYTYHGDISDAHRQIFETRMDDSRAFYAGLAGENLPGANVNVYDSSHTARACGRAAQDSLTFYLSCALVFDLPRPEVYARSTITPFDSISHEYFHLLQYHWGKLEGRRDTHPPVWLVEGSATYAATQYLIEHKDLNSASARDFRLNQVRGGEEALEHWEREWGSNNGWEYSLAYLAHEWLVAHSNSDSWLEFWSQDWEQGLWKRGFEDTFTIELSKFYERFKAWRDDGFPTLMVTS